MTDNPNEYNDRAFASASQELHNDMSTHVKALWGAGASEDDIDDEIGNAVNEAKLDAGITQSPRHHRPKKPKG
jgi:hypothetical protein